MLVILTATLVFKLTLTKVLVTLTVILVILTATLVFILTAMPVTVNSPDCHYICNITCHILTAMLVTQTNFFNRCPGHCQKSRDVPVAAS
jgi:hypothetical protein